jgi:hypothetical protein
MYGTAIRLARASRPRLSVTSRDRFCRRNQHTYDQNAECDIIKTVRENMHGVALTTARIARCGRSNVTKAVTERRFPPPWSVEDIGGCFAVKASNGRPLLFIYYRDPAGRRSLAKLLTRNAARRIALGVAKLPELLKRA